MIFSLILLVGVLFEQTFCMENQQHVKEHYVKWLKKWEKKWKPLEKEIKNSQEIILPSSSYKKQNHGNNITALGDKLLFTVDNTFHVIDTEKKVILATAELPDNNITEIAVSLDNNTIIAHAPPHLYAIDAQTLKIIAPLFKESSQSTFGFDTIKISHDGRKASAVSIHGINNMGLIHRYGKGKKLYIFDMRTNKLEHNNITNRPYLQQLIEMNKDDIPSILKKAKKIIPQTEDIIAITPAVTRAMSQNETSHGIFYNFDVSSEKEMVISSLHYYEPQEVTLLLDNKNGIVSKYDTYHTISLHNFMVDQPALYFSRKSYSKHFLSENGQEILWCDTTGICKSNLACLYNQKDKKCSIM